LRLRLRLDTPILRSVPPMKKTAAQLDAEIEAARASPPRVGNLSE